ncbi:MAG: site-specific integrase, partial [Candidatus Nanopelagicales bacterium]
GKIKRWLTAAEIGTVFGTLPTILTADRPDVPRWAADAMWLILATGQRPGEVLQMRWDHITLPGLDTDDEHGVWAMPAGTRKRVRGQRVAPPHDVPLAPVIVKRLRTMSPRKSGYVFPAKGGHKGTNDLNQRIKRGLLKHVSVEPFSPHDLRRSASTHLHKAGVQRHVVEKILGHVDSSVAGVYDRHEYWNERRTALDDWADRLVQCTQSEFQAPGHPS